MKGYGTLLPIFLLVLDTCAQRHSSSDSTIVYLGSQAHYGFIIAHRNSVRPLVENANPWGVSVELSRLRYTQGAWTTCNCYSQNGLALMYFNFDNPKILGNSINLIVFAEPNLTLKTVNISLRGGLGLSYLSKVHHPDSNPENVFFSSPVSGILLLQLTSRFWINHNLAVRLSAAYHHISNGGSQQPNLGMNFPTVSIGVDYGIGRVTLVSREKRSLSKNEIQYNAGLFFTTRKASPDEETREPLIGFSGGFFKPFARMHGVGADLEFALDYSLKERNKQAIEYIDHRVFSGLVKHHFLFGKFDFSQALGIYVYKKYPTPSEVFQRYTFEYRITKRLQVGFSLKAHLAVAEQMDVRANYVF